jgi:hypothetical protein
MSRELPQLAGWRSDLIHLLHHGRLLVRARLFPSTEEAVRIEVWCYEGHWHRTSEVSPEDRYTHMLYMAPWSVEKPHLVSFSFSELRRHEDERYDVAQRLANLMLNDWSPVWQSKEQVVVQTFGRGQVTSSPNGAIFREHLIRAHALLGWHVRAPGSGVGLTLHHRLYGLIAEQRIRHERLVRDLAMELDEK